MQKECPPGALEAILSKIVTKEDIQAARFPRFQTDQTVRLMVTATGLLIPTRMKNYSAGGAFLEYRGISLKVGDHIQVAIPAIEEKSRTKARRPFDAKVIWISSGDNPRSPSRGVGIQFQP